MKLIDRLRAVLRPRDGMFDDEDIGDDQPPVPVARAADMHAEVMSRAWGARRRADDD